MIMRLDTAVDRHRRPIVLFALVWTMLAVAARRLGHADDATARESVHVLAAVAAIAIGAVLIDAIRGFRARARI
ncbi:MULTISPECIES: hypothetical protein [unclassified Actinoplanes]|uniref:hypothetical protein n=1 Tax=unclassified Actinoplanes TaxID=2626549 RepID=UPI0012BA8C63|nr:MULTISPECIES: hypothetical protein [unclassified Actinoplanes]